DGRATRLAAGLRATSCTRSCRRLTGRCGWALRGDYCAGSPGEVGSGGRGLRGWTGCQFTAFAELGMGTCGLAQRRMVRPALMYEPEAWSGLVRNRVFWAREAYTLRFDRRQRLWAATEAG